MDKVAFFWNGAGPLVRIFVVGILTYIGIIILIRNSGKRTLTTMNAYDFIITVAIGSTFGRVLTEKEISVSEAITAFVVLISLKYIVSYIDVRSKAFSRLITSQPTLLFHHGEFLSRNMRKERIMKKDLEDAVRKKQLSSFGEVEAIILEADGTFSVIRRTYTTSKDAYQELLNEQK